MIAEEDVFPSALRSVVRGSIVVLALNILKAIVCALLGSDIRFGGMTLSDWVELGISVAVASVVLKLYWPVKTLATYYLKAFVKTGRIPGGERCLPSLSAIGESLTQLVFLLIIYRCFLPVILQCNDAFFHFRDPARFLNVAVVLAAAGVLFLLWKNAHPLVDLLTGHITDKVTVLSSGAVSASCPSCSAKNVRGSLYCVSCGTRMEEQAAEAPACKNNCPQCAAENVPSAKFCSRCGTPLG